MAKPSLGFSSPMMNTSTYVRQHLMLYPQTPIVTTQAMGLLGLDKRPAGQNCVVAVIPSDGYNIEDAIVLSKATVDRGFARTFFYRIYGIFNIISVRWYYSYHTVLSCRSFV
jgi:DNA-directed RNA polymerase subunit B